MGDDKLQVGKVYGCYRIIKDSDSTKNDIDKLIQELNKCIDDVSGTIEKLYKLIQFKACTCETNCGREMWVTQKEIEALADKNCDTIGCESCKFRSSRKVDVRVNHQSCNNNYTGLQFDTLKVIEKLDRKYEELSIKTSIQGSLLTSTKYDLYRCRCDLCGTQYVFRSDMFRIGTADNPNFIGNIENIKARCDCHAHSINQWVICKLLIENRVNYKAEYSPSDLKGIGDNVQLHYDFAVFNSNGSVKCFIEYNGEQHNTACKQFGGERGLAVQKCIDELKRIYAREKNIRLIEIQSSARGYNAIRSILKNARVI